VANLHHPLPQRYTMIALTGALILGLVLCYYVALPFIPALVWSLTLAVLFAPVERALRRKVAWPALSASLTLPLAAIMVVVPAVLVSTALFNELLRSADLVSQLFAKEPWHDLGRQHRWLAPTINWIVNHTDPADVLQSISTRLGDWSTSLLQGSVTGIANLLLTFYFLFYFLRDGPHLRASLERMLPLTHAEYRTLCNGVVMTIFASVYGTVTVAVLQGVLAGLMFWWLGLPSPAFWGVIMGLLAIVPFLGAFIVWAPVAVMLALNGQLLEATALALWGTIIVGLVDNIIYPILVGRRLAMHSMLSFIAIIGGLALVGVHGIVLGPVIVALSLALMEIWRNRLDMLHAVPPGTDRNDG